MARRRCLKSQTSRRGVGGVLNSPMDLDGFIFRGKSLGMDDDWGAPMTQETPMKLRRIGR